MVRRVPSPAVTGAERAGRDEPIYVTIHAVLKDHLKRGALPAGLVLGQANVARAFNVSRVPAAMALARLVEEGLLESFEGRGYVVPGGDPHRADLATCGLVVPGDIANPSAARREQIYSEVEHAVAACLPYGRFMLNETALAHHYQVSRTIAHEVLTQLERLGIIEQDSNNRWYAGPIDADDLTHHFELRWLLEPQALRQAAPRLNRDDLAARLTRLRPARSGSMQPLEREKLEDDLHVHTLAPCPNDIILGVVRRSQRILIATHSAFAEYQNDEEIRLMASEHARVYEALLADDVDAAAGTLEMHLRRSLGPNLEILRRLGPLPENLRPAFLVPAKPAPPAP